MLYLCCTKLGITLVNPLFIGYCKAIYDKPLLVAVFYFSVLSNSNKSKSDLPISLIMSK